MIGTWFLYLSSVEKENTNMSSKRRQKKTLTKQFFFFIFWKKQKNRTRIFTEIRRNFRCNKLYFKILQSPLSSSRQFHLDFYEKKKQQKTLSNNVSLFPQLTRFLSEYISVLQLSDTILVSTRSDWQAFPISKKIQTNLFYYCPRTNTFLFFCKSVWCIRDWNEWRCSMKH